MALIIIQCNYSTMSTLSNPNILIFQLPGVGHQDRSSSSGRVETLRVFDQSQKIQPLLSSQLGGDAGTHKHRYCRYHCRYGRYYCRYCRYYCRYYFRFNFLDIPGVHSDKVIIRLLGHLLPLDFECLHEEAAVESLAGGHGGD